MRKKAKVLIMVMVVLVAMSMAASQALAVAPVVGVACVNDVGNSSEGGGPLAMCAVAAARMCEYAGCTVYMIDSGDILDNNILDSIDMLVVPGGWTPGIATYFAPDRQSPVRNAIRDFVDNGGAYLGLCSGGFLATDYACWPIADNPRQQDKWPYYLNLFNGECWGPLDDLSDYPMDPAARVPVRMVDPDFGWNGQTYIITYHWGGYFTGPDDGPLPDGVDCVGVYDYEGKYDEEAAFIKFSFGNGRVFLTGPHAEYEESSTLSNSRDWCFGDDYNTGTGEAVADPDTEWDLMVDVLAWLMPTKTVSSGNLPAPHSNTAAVYGTRGNSARVTWATMKMLRSLGIEPYAYDSAGATEITTSLFDLSVYPNGVEKVMDDYVDKPTIDTFVANGGDLIGIGGGANLVGVHFGYWDASYISGKNLKIDHGMVDVPITDPDTGSGTYSIAYWEAEAAVDGHHWDGAGPDSPASYTPIGWEISDVEAAGATVVGTYYISSGPPKQRRDIAVMIKYPYGTGGGKIFLSSVDPGTEEGSLNDGCQWDNGTKGYFDSDSEWGLIDNILAWMGL